MEYKMWVNPDVNLKDTKESLEIDSGTTIATLEIGKSFAEIRVVGDVRIWFNPNEGEDPMDGEYYSRPSEFPEELKEIIGKPFNADNLEEHWSYDSRIYCSDSNWFEIFVFDDKSDTLVPDFNDIVDVEGHTDLELFSTLYEYLTDCVAA